MAELRAERVALERLLLQYNERPDQRQRIAAEIDQRFRRTLAILVVDSSGFTRSVHENGIIHFLAQLERLARVALPLIGRHGGRLLKREADNIYAVFPDPTAALRCAVAIGHDVAVANEVLPEQDEVYVSIGIGYGSVLVLDDDDLFGDEMNRACKLGEDLAARGEILLTSSAYAALGEAQSSFEPTIFSISGLSLEAYRYLEA